MPSLSFELSSATHSFVSYSETEELCLELVGKHQDIGNGFDVHLGSESWCALGAPVTVEIVRQPIQGDSQIALEMNSNENFIQLGCPSSHGEQPSFYIRISLPADVYQRVLNIDWTKETVSISVSTRCTRSNSEDPLSYLHDSDPDGGDQVWVADRSLHQRIDEFDLVIQSLPTQGVRQLKINMTDESGKQKTLRPEELLVHAIERIATRIEDLQKNSMYMAWLLALLITLGLLFK